MAVEMIVVEKTKFSEMPMTKTDVGFMKKETAAPEKKAGAEFMLIAASDCDKGVVGFIMTKEKSASTDDNTHEMEWLAWEEK